MSGPVGIALIGMGWWGQKILTVLQAAPADIRVLRAVEPNLETVKAVCAEKGVPLSASYADALNDPTVEAVVLAIAAKPITTVEIPPAEPVKDNLGSFARAVGGAESYPIAGAQLVDNIALLEAVFASASSGKIQAVA